MLKHYDEREKALWWKGMGISFFVFVFLLIFIIGFFTHKFSNPVYPIILALCITLILNAIYEFINDLSFFDYKRKPVEISQAIKSIVAMIVVVFLIFIPIPKTPSIGEWDSLGNYFLAAVVIVRTVLEVLQWYKYYKLTNA